MTGLVGANEFVLKFVDLAVEFVFSNLVSRDIGLEILDGGTSLLFRGFKLRDARLHEIIDELQLHDTTP